jgi:orotidine-5'-phosphate decarboxylase
MRRLICSLDWAGPEHAVELARRLKGAVGGIKVGAEFMTLYGTKGVEALGAVGLPLILDLKLDDLPKAVSNTVRRVAGLKPFAITVHAAGGPAMLRVAMAAAHAAADGGGFPRPKLLAVTVLTSMDEADLKAIGIGGSMREQVLRMAALTHACGLDGVWTSADELSRLRAEFGPDFLLVVPGIRPVWSSSDDQKRIMTPGDAIHGGADYLVVGRPITQASDPAAAARRIVDEMNAARVHTPDIVPSTI